MRNTRIGPTSTILFDAGNTLAFLDLDRVARVLRDHGVPVDPAALEAAEALARAAMIRRGATAPQLSDRQRWDVYVETMITAIAPSAAGENNGVSDALETAHRRDNLWRRVDVNTPLVLDRLLSLGFRLGVVSNADGRVRALLEQLGLAHRFETIVDSHEVGVEKPDPRIFEIALTQMGERPENTVYVGDLPEVDVVGAARAGITPVLLDPLGITRNAKYAVIARLDELESLLREP